MIGWDYPLLGGGNIIGLNDSAIASFEGSKIIHHLVRETIQNSIDARLDKTKPVKVEFQKKTISRDTYSYFLDPLQDTLERIKNFKSVGKDVKGQTFLNTAIQTCSNEDVDFLIVSDFNTIGLTEPGSEDGNFYGLTDSSGVSIKETGSGGSFGIGKMVTFAVSNCRTVIYNTITGENNATGLIGVSRLATHERENGLRTQGVHYYRNKEKQQPILNDEECHLRTLFDRNELGTDIAIVGFRKIVNWEEEIEKEIIINFFHAIMDKTLVVAIQGRILDHTTLERRIEYFYDLEKRKRESERNKKMIQTFEGFNAVKYPDQVKCFSLLSDEDLIVYIKRNKEYSNNIIEMRANGMFIKNRTKRTFLKYSAVVVAKGKELNEILKLMEPPQHDKWDPAIIGKENNLECYKKGKKVKEQIIHLTNSCIDEICKGKETDEIDLEEISMLLPYEEIDRSLSGESCTFDTTMISVNVPGKTQSITNKDNRVKMKSVAIHGNIESQLSDLSEENNNQDTEESNNGRNTLNDRTSRNNVGESNNNSENELQTQGESNRESVLPKIVQQRIFQMPHEDFYRMKIKFDTDLEQVNLAFRLVDSDYQKELLTIKKVRIDEVETSINAPKLTLNRVRGGVWYKIFLYFKYSEKMRIEILTV